MLRLNSEIVLKKLSFIIMPQRLDFIILPSRILAFEWANSDTTTDKAVERLEQRLFREFQTDNGKGLIMLGLASPGLCFSPSVSFWYALASRFTKELLILPELEKLRGKAHIPLPDEDLNLLLDSAPPMTGSEFLDAGLLNQVWQVMHGAFTSEAKTWTGSMEGLFKSLTPDHELSNRIHFHLVENKKGQMRSFAFMATYSTDLGKGSGEMGYRHVPLQYALKEFAGDEKKLIDLLSTVHRAARESGFLKEILKSGELFQPISLEAKDAYRFLTQVPAFEKAGILCRIPRWWGGRPKSISLGMSVGNTAPGQVGADSLLDFQAWLHIGGERITETDARRILSQSEGLSFIKGKWIAVDDKSLKQTLELFEKAKIFARDNHISLADAMSLLMDTSGSKEDVLTQSQILCGSWLQSTLGKLSNPSLIRTTTPGKGVRASLRPYQAQGLSWLHFLHNLGFGMCLADDMGLGKTVQVLALLQTLKETKGSGFGTCLLVVPASLLSNWQEEISKFTPTLKAVVAHPQALSPGEFNNLPERTGSWDLIITTYTMARKLTWIKSRQWYYVILDEAQAIKNPGTAQTRAIKAIKGIHRLVLTGTPVENRLTDLWSLFDFINPGLLGGFKNFQSFTKTLQNDPTGYSRLRRTVRAYILRRLKTDKSVIKDLPDKIEMKTFASLSKTQVVLYQNLVDTLRGDLAASEGIKRRGVVLGYLTKFKQLCNHPDHFNGQSAYSEDESGKFARLRDICLTIYEKREKVLIFTQFREVIEPLNRFLQAIFHCQGLMLHGGTAINKRKALVSQFQSDAYVPYFILSLKAGGLGLNLTAANHVIHFDRWWNPAVEDQATDRAFRIGQKKNVVVHKMICQGTIEEKIDTMIEGKKSLSKKVLAPAGEGWITEMPDSELVELFKLNIS